MRLDQPEPIMPKHVLALIAFCLLISVVARAVDLKTLATQAVSTDADQAASAIAALRAMGPDGLAAILDVHRKEIDFHKEMVSITPNCTPEWQRLAHAIDTVAAQRDAWASGLYWYTDLDQAKRAARQQHKPILSLRLLGKLDEEYSCANSRFFRTALYANQEIANYLSKNFILHWQSVRPVPKITIDFGDGRKIERTITGNSVHYVLSSDGQLIDAVPGLYGPKTFLSLLETDADLATKLQTTTDRASQLASFHLNAMALIDVRYGKDLAAIRAQPAMSIAPPEKKNAAPSAKKAAPIAISKGRVEAPVLNLSMPGDAVALEDAMWKKIAALHADDAKLDPSSVTLVASKQDPAAAMRRAMSKSIVENPLLKIVSNFERSIAEDTVRNEYVLHRQIHAWLTQQPIVNLDSFNERVYADLFLTPSSDPWLGLAPANTYTALPSEGLVVSQK
jgi:hypothetical protein